MNAVDQGIFLHRIPYSDSSLIVWFYTKKNGLQRFIFKGGKKKAHNLVPMVISELTYFGRSNADLLNLTSVDNRQGLNTAFDPVKTTIAFFMAETIRKCAHAGDQDGRMYLFCVEKVEELEKGLNLTLLPIKFLLEFSDVLGFKPLYEKGSGNVFNLQEGLFQNIEYTSNLTRKGDGVALIQTLLKGDNITKENIEKKFVREEALKIMLDYYKIHVPGFKDLSSYEIVKEILTA